MGPELVLAAHIGLGRRETDVARADDEAPPLRHRVASVHRQVEQCLFQLVDLDDREVLIDEHDSVAQMLEQAADARIGQFERGLGAVLFGGITRQALVADDGACSSWRTLEVSRTMATVPYPRARCELEVGHGAMCLDLGPVSCPGAGIRAEVARVELLLLLAAAAVEPGAGRIQVEEAPIGGGREDHLGQVQEQGSRGLWSEHQWVGHGVTVGPAGGDPSH